MNPNVFKIILHLGMVIRSVKDVEKTVSDAVKGDNIVGDLKSLADDVAELFDDGLIMPPEGLTVDQVKAMLTEFKTSIG